MFAFRIHSHCKYLSYRIDGTDNSNNNNAGQEQQQQQQALEPLLALIPCNNKTSKSGRSCTGTENLSIYLLSCGINGHQNPFASIRLAAEDLRIVIWTIIIVVYSSYKTFLGRWYVSLQIWNQQHVAFTGIILLVIYHVNTLRYSKCTTFDSM